MVKYKKLSKTRTITIPKDISAEAGIYAGTAVEMVKTNEGILIRKHIPACVYCRSPKDVHSLRGVEVCSECAKEIRRELDKIYA